MPNGRHRYMGHGLRPTQEPRPPIRRAGGMTAWETLQALNEAYRLMREEYEAEVRLARRLTPPEEQQRVMEEYPRHRRVALPPPRLWRDVMGRAPGLRSAYGRPEYPPRADITTPEEPPFQFPSSPPPLGQALDWRRPFAPDIRVGLENPLQYWPARYAPAPEYRGRLEAMPVHFNPAYQQKTGHAAGAYPYHIETSTLEPWIMLHEYGHLMQPGRWGGWPKLAYRPPGMAGEPVSMRFRQALMKTPQWGQALRLAQTHTGTLGSPAWHEAYAQYPNWLAEIPPEMREWYPWLESTLPWGIRRRR